LIAILVAVPLLWILLRSEKALRTIERDREDHLASERRFGQDRLRERGD
jgi:hypothetical protein